MQLIPLDHNTTKVILDNVDDFTNNYAAISFRAIKKMVAYYHKNLESIPNVDKDITEDDIDILYTPNEDNRTMNVAVNIHQTGSIISKYKLWKYERSWQTVKKPLLGNPLIPLSIDLYKGVLDIVPHKFIITIAFNY